MHTEQIQLRWVTVYQRVRSTSSWPTGLSRNAQLYYNADSHLFSLQIQNNNKPIKNTADSSYIEKHNNLDGMQEMRVRTAEMNTGSPNHSSRPMQLFSVTSFNDSKHLHINQSRSPSSEEDNSPTEMNNCRKLMDKPPLVCIYSSTFQTVDFPKRNHI